MKSIEQKIQEWKVNNFQNEKQFQAAAIMMISQEFPQLRGLVFHPMNEWYIEKRANETDKQYKQRCQIIGNQAKAQGVTAGVTDIIIFWNGIRYAPELKQPKGTLSDDQKKIHKAWNEDCPEIPTIICYTVYDVYEYVLWIIQNDLRINFDNFIPFYKNF